MSSFRASRHFEGGPISLRGAARLESRTYPLSLRDFVASDGARQFGGKISSGDVDCTWSVAVWQNGFWSVSGAFHDGGTLAGDFFFVEFRFGQNQSVGAKLQGSILDVIQSRHLSLAANGSDPWIRDNWNSFESSGPTVRLHVAPAVGQLVVAPIALLTAVPSAIIVAAGVAVVGGIFVVGVASGKAVVAQRCDDSLATPDLPAGSGMPGQPGGPQPACVQFKLVDPGTQQ